MADLARETPAGYRRVVMSPRPDTTVPPPHTSQLTARLKERIARDGPLSVADYMQACLADESAGYYMARDTIGAAGDFITAPEISQIFGELLGAWAAAVWRAMGEPLPVTVAELGPGRGTLMADALRAWRSVPRLSQGVALALVETSPRLRAAQQAALRASAVQVHWYDRLEEVPHGPLILIANEFLDALPIRQVVRRGGYWRERRVTIGRDGGFAFCDAEPAGAESGVSLPDAPEGAIVEIRPAMQRLAAELAERASEAPLAALFVDYGHGETGLGDTLQAVRRHRYADPLDAPGESDLTAHVDFAALRRVADGRRLNVYGPLPQGEFLLKLGLGLRRDRLLAQATPAQREAVESGAARLVDPRQMGMLFKAMAVTSAGLAPPPPFADK